MDHMIQYLHIEQDTNNALHIDSFRTEEEAVTYSAVRIRKAITELLGENYVVPDADIDEEGFIEHYGRNEEISSSPLGWYVYDGNETSVRGYIVELDGRSER